MHWGVVHWVPTNIQPQERHWWHLIGLSILSNGELVCSCACFCFIIFFVFVSDRSFKVTDQLTNLTLKVHPQYIRWKVGENANSKGHVTQYRDISPHSLENILENWSQYCQKLAHWGGKILWDFMVCPCIFKHQCLTTCTQDINISMITNNNTGRLKIMMNHCAQLHGLGMSL